jgi:predicted  nucleic acid-binding Zn-ribbon protein
METQIKRQDKQVDDLQRRLADADSKFVAYKQSVEQSPINVLRNELAQKQIEIVDLESKMGRVAGERDEYKVKFDKLKKDMIALKK